MPDTTDLQLAIPFRYVGQDPSCRHRFCGPKLSPSPTNGKRSGRS